MPGGLSLSPGWGGRGREGRRPGGAAAEAGFARLPAAGAAGGLRPEPAMAESLRRAGAIPKPIISRRLLRVAGVVRGVARPGEAGAKQAKPAFAARRAAGLRPGSLRLAEPLDTTENRMGLQKDRRKDMRMGEKEKAIGSPLPYRNFFPSAGLSRPGNG